MYSWQTLNVSAPSSLSSNAIGPSGGTVIANALRHNRTIVKIRYVPFDHLSYLELLL